VKRETKHVMVPSDIDRRGAVPRGKEAGRDGKDGFALN